MAQRIPVIVSQGQSQSPAKRNLEELIVTTLMLEPNIDVTIVPHLYDLTADSTGVLAMSGIDGDMVVISWLYERAARWTLDRNGIRGHAGFTNLATRDEDAVDDTPESADEISKEDSASALRRHDATTKDAELSVQQPQPLTLPNRNVYCLELTASTTCDEVMNEVRRIATELTTQVVELSQWLDGDPSAASLQRFATPTNGTALNGNGTLAPPLDASRSEVQVIEEPTERRWYPVIDFGRCTNCMECIDFCLFGVYGVDTAETILVEQPDNCRKGCPACSRVCPENAIMFPQHKSPGIAGAPVAVGSMKIDLSKLFGAPDAAEIAARERDEQLELAGRKPAGLPAGVPKRQAHPESLERDELDELIDELDASDL